MMFFKRLQFTCIPLLLISNTCIADVRLSSVEVALPRVVQYFEDDPYRSISGSLLFTGSNPLTEIVFPFYWRRDNEEGASSVDELELAKVDVQWRKYYNEKRSGFYYGAHVRVMYIKGRVDTVSPSVVESDTRLGVGLVWGVRVNMGKTFYWGANVNVTGYFETVSDYRSASLDLFDESRADLKKVTVNAEFLKFGWRF